MSDIDEKLREIFDELYETRESNRLVNMGLKQYTIKPNPTSKAITQIKQAFADEGYEKRTLGRDFTARVDLREVMTGQEWYDRFETTLESWIFMNDYDRNAAMSGGEVIDRDQILEAAKRASGLSNE